MTIEDLMNDALHKAEKFQCPLEPEELHQLLIKDVGDALMKTLGQWKMYSGEQSTAVVEALLRISSAVVGQMLAAQVVQSAELQKLSQKELIAHPAVKKAVLGAAAEAGQRIMGAFFHFTHGPGRAEFLDAVEKSMGIRLDEDPTL